MIKLEEIFFGTAFPELNIERGDCFYEASLGTSSCEVGTYTVAAKWQCIREPLHSTYQKERRKKKVSKKRAIRNKKQYSLKVPRMSLLRVLLLADLG